jgi:hypothetical protein
MPSEPMFSLPALTGQVLSIFPRPIRMRVILLLEPVIIPLQLTFVQGTYFLADMLGFKLELPQREDGITKKTRPIYLDMQVVEIMTFWINVAF